jgi:maltose O-acetyltransferase
MLRLAFSNGRGVVQERSATFAARPRGEGSSLPRAKWLERVSALSDKAVRAAAAEVKMSLRATVVAGFTSVALPQFAFVRVRTAILRAAGVHIGKRSAVMGGFRVTGNWRRSEVRIGDDVVISGPLHIDGGAAVTIGDRVNIGHNVVLITATHRIGAPAQRCGPIMEAPITVGDGAWIASCVTILPGVKVGAGSIVAAGAVVVRDVDPNTMVAGVPAVLVRTLADHAQDPPTSSTGKWVR